MRARSALVQGSGRRENEMCRGVAAGGCLS
jgi:hypothetical protein